MNWDELVEAAEVIRAEAVSAEPGLASLTLAGIGWATVEHERAERELDTLLGAVAGDQSPGPWVPLDRDHALGARRWLRATPSPHGKPAVIALEPDTEGRLAASLVRFGEGVAVIYLGDGPVGAGRLVRGGRPWGPHVVIT